MEKLICEAISGKYYVEFMFDGHYRAVEPHALGYTTRGNLVLSCYQTAGGSKSGKVPAWKRPRVDGITDLKMLDQRFSGPRDGYNPDTDQMPEVICQL